MWIVSWKQRSFNACTWFLRIRPETFFNGLGSDEPSNRGSNEPLWGQESKAHWTSWWLLWPGSAWWKIFFTGMSSFTWHKCYTFIFWYQGNAMHPLAASTNMNTQKDAKSASKYSISNKFDYFTNKLNWIVSVDWSAKPISLFLVAN